MSSEATTCQRKYISGLIFLDRRHICKTSSWLALSSRCQFLLRLCYPKMWSNSRLARRYLDVTVYVFLHIWSALWTSHKRPFLRMSVQVYMIVLFSQQTNLGWMKFGRDPAVLILVLISRLPMIPHLRFAWKQTDVDTVNQLGTSPQCASDKGLEGDEGWLGVHSGCLQKDDVTVLHTVSAKSASVIPTNK